MDIVEALLAHGADPNAAASDGCTPLHYAAREDAAGAVAALLRGGADADAVNAGGRRAEEEIYDDTDGGEGEDIARMLRNAPSVVVSRESVARGCSTSGTGTATRKPATTLAGVVVSRESVSPLEVAMADLALELGREKLRASVGLDAWVGGWGRGGRIRGRGERIGGRGERIGRGSTGRRRLRGRRVRAAQPACPAASWSRGRTSPPRTTTCAPERVEARAVVVKLDADGALPREMYADDSKGNTWRRARLTLASATGTIAYRRRRSPGLRSADGRRGVARARWRRRRRIRTRGLIGTRESFTAELSRRRRAKL